MNPRLSSTPPRPGRPAGRNTYLPDRQISMWPRPGSSAGTSHADPDQIDAVTADAGARLDPRPPAPTLRQLTGALADLAYTMIGQQNTAQHALLATIADRYKIDHEALSRAVSDIDGLILTALRSRPESAEISADGNRLRDADLTVAAELHLSRVRLADLTAHTSPDLPRLALLLNGLTHGIAAAELFTVPATLPGRPHRPATVRGDLVGWQGLPDAVNHLGAVLTASGKGRRWIRRGLHGGADDVGRGIGVLHLTHPSIAADLAAVGPDKLDPTDLRAVAQALRPFPERITELSDLALAAVCDRNGWLLGRPEEHHHRLLLDEHLTRTISDLPALRRRLAAPDVDSTQLLDLPADTLLPRPIQPASADVHHYLRLASAQALHDFAGLPLTTPPGRCAALAARWPPTILERAVALQGVPLLSQPDISATPTPPSPPTLATGP